MQVLLRPTGLEVLVLESSDFLASAGAAQSRLYPSRSLPGAELMARLHAGTVDMVFVHYEIGSYLHYVSVDFVDGAPWRVGAAKRDAVDGLYAASALCRAVRQGEADLARTLLLTKLRGQGSLDGTAAVL